MVTSKKSFQLLPSSPHHLLLRAQNPGSPTLCDQVLSQPFLEKPGQWQPKSYARIRHRPNKDGLVQRGLYQIYKVTMISGCQKLPT